MNNHHQLNFFCSALSMKGAEPLGGTAMAGSQYVFISWPKTFWATKQFESLNFPEGLSNFLQTLQKERRVITRLTHQHGRESNEHSQILIMPDRVTYTDVPIQEIENVLRVHFTLEGGHAFEAKTTEGTYIFCCTHGKRDNCCAKFGQPILYELQRVALEKAFDLHVWECTHLATDRLAAVAVAFPHGYMYGRLRVDDIPDLVEYLIKGYPYPPRYRGQLGLGAVEQTAQVFGHFYWFKNNIENATVTVDAVNHSDDIGAALATVTIGDRYSSKIHARFALQFRKQDFQTYIDCEGVKANKIRRVSRWIISDSQIIR
jgi:hypothetical protein